MHPTLQEPFKQYMTQKLGSQYPLFEHSLETPPAVSIRTNPQKPLPAPPTTQQVPWCYNGYYLPQRPLFTADPTFHAGAYYVQEASSMFIEQAILQARPTHKTNLRILDLCAAPGGKSTHLLSLITPNDLLISNEVIKTRLPILQQNIIKWGYPNVAVTQHDVADFAPLQNFFDIILIDAPCSGEGLFRKDKDARNEWSPQNVQLCAERQQRILAAAVPLLAPQGILIYSTCTYNHYENENNVRWVLHTFPQLQPYILPTVPDSWNIETQTYPDGSTGYQLYPHRLLGEGFFMSIFQKQQNDTPQTPPSRNNTKTKWDKTPQKTHEQIEWTLNQPNTFQYFTFGDEIRAIPTQLTPDFQHISATCKRMWCGTAIGTLNKNIFQPTHQLALSTYLSPQVPRLPLDLEQAQKYLKKDTINIPQQTTNGWHVVTHQNLPLGWAKIINNSRINNYLPTDWRIRMDIS